MTDTITLPRKTVQQALEALESSKVWISSALHKAHRKPKVEAAITALRAALQQAEPKAQEDKTEQGVRRSKLIGNSVEGMMESGLSFTQALDAMLKVYDHDEPQAQAGEPKTPSWWKCSTHGPGNFSAWGCPECVREMRDEIKRLQAQKEHYQDQWSDVCNENQVLLNAIAKKDAALQACVEALVEMHPSGPTGSAIWHQQMDAITQAQEAMK